MGRTRIRWQNVARLAAGLGGATLVIALLAVLLAPQPPQPLPADVGLDGLGGDAVAYVPPRESKARRSKAGAPKAPAHAAAACEAKALARAASAAGATHAEGACPGVSACTTPACSAPGATRSCAGAQCRRAARARPASGPQPRAPNQAATRRQPVRVRAVSTPGTPRAPVRRRVRDRPARLPGRGGPGAGGLLHGHAVQLGDAFSEASWQRSSDHYAARQLCGTDQGLQVFHDASDTGLGHYGAWVWQAPPGTVFTNVNANSSVTSQAGHRGSVFATTPAGEEVAFGIEHSDFRFHSLDRRVHPVRQQAALHRAGRRPAVWTGRRRLRPRLRSRRLPAHRGPLSANRDDHRRLAVRRRGRPRSAGPHVRRARRRERDPQGLRGRQRHRAGHRHPQLRRRRGIRDRPHPVSPRRRASRRRSRRRARRSSPGPDNFVVACVEDLATDGFANRTCEPRQVWVDNACPASAVGGGSALSAGFGADGSTAGTSRSDRGAVIRGAVAGARRRSDRVRALAGAGRSRRRRRDNDHRSRRLLRATPRPRPEPRGLRPLRQRRHGRRSPRPRPDGCSATAVRRAPHPRRPQPRPPVLHRAPPGSRMYGPSREGPGQARQIALAGLSHRPHRRRLPLQRPLQAASDAQRSPIPVPRARPPGRGLSLRTRRLADVTR